MEKFIDKIVSQLLQNSKDLEKTILILPGNRPKLFFRRAFQKQQENILLPRFLSIDEFVQSVSGLQPISQIQLWFQAYDSYQKVVEKPDEFESFLKWIPTLQKDFDDINSSLVNAEELFDYLVSAERIKKWGQDELEVGSNQLMSKHLYFWKMARDLFFKLNEDLLEKGLAYRGLLYKKAVEKLPEYLEGNESRFVFAGLNALSNAERKILFELNKYGNTKLYWDSDRYYMEDVNQESGLFLRQYKESLDEWNWEFDNFSQPKKIQVTGIGKRVGQAKYLHRILEEIPEDEWTDTAVVLAEEGLLPAVLSSIPEKISKANITMGFPLNKSTMAYFFRSVFELQMNREKLGNGTSYYFKNVLDILGNTIFREETSVSTDFAVRIRRENYIFSSPNFLLENLKESIFQALFQIPENPIAFVSRLQDWVDEQMRESKLKINELDKEYLYRFSLLFAQLKEELGEFSHIKDFKTLYVLYNRLLQNETISFVGEPLEGLQIVGLLETRLLDFKNVIILSVNDGILPPGRVENSFIPYDIRRETGLNTFTENDAVFAYHFYRLLQRAKKIELIYNTEPDSMGSGEKSRFITQIDIESGHSVQHKIAAPEFLAPVKQDLIIPKTEKVMEALNSWAEKRISPSSLNTYLRNPVQFYQQYVLGLDQFEEAEETVGARVLGNIVHKSLEELYKPLLNKILIPSDIKPLLEKLETVVEECFKAEYKSGEYKKGKNYLIYKIVYSFVENVLKNDLKMAENSEFVIHSLEQNVKVDFLLANGREVKIGGIIDRIDSVNGRKRIIDYKTGFVDEKALNINSEKLGKVFTENKFSLPLQLLLYAEMFFRNAENQFVQFGIYPLKYPKKGVISLKIDKEFEFDNEILNWIDQPLSGLIEEILNPEIPFTPVREMVESD